MFFRQMLSGATVSRAPEDDDGFEIDEDLDDQTLDDDAEPDDEPDEPDEPDDALDADPAPDPEPRRPTRGENAVVRAKRELREANERAARLEQEMAALVQRANRAPQETPEQLRARLDAMDPLERIEYRIQQQELAANARLQQIEFETREAADKAAYEVLSQQRSIAAKLKDEVEARLADMRRNGTTASREVVLKYVIGDRALANAGRATSRAQKTATANRERNTTRPASGRGDVAGSDSRRGDTPQARAKRLENMIL